MHSDGGDWDNRLCNEYATKVTFQCDHSKKKEKKATGILGKVTGGWVGVVGGGIMIIHVVIWWVFLLSKVNRIRHKHSPQKYDCDRYYVKNPFIFMTRPGYDYYDPPPNKKQRRLKRGVREQRRAAIPPVERPG